MKRPCCPSCGSFNLRHFERKGTYKCDSCGMSRFTQVNYRDPNPPGVTHKKAVTRRKSNGSGVIAGRIEVGRGSVWGAGRA